MLDGAMTVTPSPKKRRLFTEGFQSLTAHLRIGWHIRNGLASVVDDTGK